MAVLPVLQKFADNTTLHGAPKIFRANTWYKRLYWLLMFIFAVSVFSYQLSLLLKKYFAYEKRFNIEIRSDGQAFPIVTICNSRAFDVLILRQIYDYYSLEENTGLYNNPNKHVNQTKLNQTAITNEKTFLAKFDEFYQVLRNLLRSRSQEEKNIINKMLSPSIFRYFNQSEIESAMTQFSDFFIKYSSQRERYSIRSIYGSNFLQCFTYDLDSQSPNVDLRPSWLATVLDGQGMLPTAEERSKVPREINTIFEKCTTASGLSVYFHPKGSYPPITMPDRIRQIQPGNIATFYISSRKTERLGPPHGKCLDAYPFKPHPEGPYIQSSCYEICMYNEIQATCGCQFEYYSHLVTASIQNNISLNPLPYCYYPTIDQVTKYQTRWELKANYEKILEQRFCTLSMATNNTAKLLCDNTCQLACTEYNYDVEMEVNKITKKHANIWYKSEAGKIARKVIANNDNTDRLNLLKDYFNISIAGTEKLDESRSRVELNVDLNTFASEIIDLRFELKSKDLSLPVTSEVPDYTFYQLLSDIGGQLGLWIGMSIITALEILNLLFDLIRVACRKCSSASRSSTANV